MGGGARQKQAGDKDETHTEGAGIRNARRYSAPIISSVLTSFVAELTETRAEGWGGVGWGG